MSSQRFIIKTSHLIGDLTAQPPQNIMPPLISGDMSDDIIGPTTVLVTGDQVAYQVRWTSSDAVGVISVQGSVTGLEADFIDLTFDPALAQPNSDDGVYLINLALIPFPYIRIKYTRDSGDGLLSVYLSAKGL